MAAQRFGDYELVQYLAAGGMADLYLARSPKFEKDVVLKRIQPRYAEMTRVVKMFIDEGRIAQALDHPNIVRVLDVGQERGTYFIAMEYIPGPDLLAICRRGMEVGKFLPRPLSLAIMAQVLKGLSYAHEKKDAAGDPLKVVHCDISPGNIVVSWGGTAKIVDFGISRATIQLRSEDHSVAGKYNYMAPEQIRGEPIDGRADLFALGIILYEITVGKRLFRGRPEEVMRLVLDKPIPRPREVRPDYPPALEELVMRALERDPDRRIASARQFRREVLSCLAELEEAHDKRAVARYLQEIFAAPKIDTRNDIQGYKKQAEQFRPELQPEEEDLELERTPIAMLTESQRLKLLEVDPEDAEMTPEPRKLAHKFKEAEQPKPHPEPPRAHSGPPPGGFRAEFLLITVALGLAFALYFLITR